MYVQHIWLPKSSAEYPLSINSLHIKNVNHKEVIRKFVSKEAQDSPLEVAILQLYLTTRSCLCDVILLSFSGFEAHVAQRNTAQIGSLKACQKTWTEGLTKPQPGCWVLFKSSAMIPGQFWVSLETNFKIKTCSLEAETLLSAKTERMVFISVLSAFLERLYPIKIYPVPSKYIVARYYSIGYWLSIY